MAARGFDYWIDKLTQIEMPALGHALRQLNSLTGDEDVKVNQLAEVILQDANLTAQVIRIANSVHYNPSSYPINTVSRAVVIIGFTGIRAICISTMVVDLFLKGKPREQLKGAMAKGFHAAVQARRLMRRARSEVQEEVFVAALLFQVGELAFWASATKDADKLEKLLAHTSIDHEKAVTQVTGTSFRALSQALATSWKLGETLTQALAPPNETPSPKVRAVRLGVELSHAISQGWECKALKTALLKVVEFSGLSPEHALTSIQRSSKHAMAVARIYGVSDVTQVIPDIVVPADSQTSLQSQVETQDTDPLQQLKRLREMAIGTAKHLDVNAIFRMAMEGIHHGLGLERVVLGLIHKGELKAQHVLGGHTPLWKESFVVSLAPSDKTLFTHAIAAGKPIWLSHADLITHQHLYNTTITQLLGKQPAFISTIKLGRRDVALLYADTPNNGILSKAQFDGFCHFVLQTQMSLEILADKSHHHEERLQRELRRAKNDLARQKRATAEELRRQAEHFRRQQALRENQHSISATLEQLDPHSPTDARHILGIAETQSFSEIRSTYRQLMSIYHPDKIARLSGRRKQQVEEEAKLINVAWKTLRQTINTQH